MLTSQALIASRTSYGDVLEWYIVEFGEFEHWCGVWNQYEPLMDVDIEQMEVSASWSV